jgi:uncharacterized caspase-like protein
MPKLYGAQRMVLQAILDAQGDTPAFVEDSQISQTTKIALRDARDWFLTLDHDELVDLALTESGLRASVTAKGRLALGLYRPFPTAAGPSTPEPPRAGAKTGRERALVIGVSAYPPPIPQLPAVANDAREVATLLGSAKGQFLARNVTSVVDQGADWRSTLDSLEKTFGEVQTDDAVFVYMAGHGAVVEGEYFFVAHDTRVDSLPTTGVPLTKIKAALDASPSQRAFLWLDFCHSGGILARDFAAPSDDRRILERALKVVRGQGKLILAACTPHQSAWESANVGHGLFTDALLNGLKGGAANTGEVTINSLFDFIDRQMGSDRQRPMMFGQMTGRVVLMRYS